MKLSELYEDMCPVELCEDCECSYYDEFCDLMFDSFCELLGENYGK